MKLITATTPIVRPPHAEVFAYVKHTFPNLPLIDQLLVVSYGITLDADEDANEPWRDVLTAYVARLS